MAQLDSVFNLVPRNEHVCLSFNYAGRTFKLEAIVFAYTYREKVRFKLGSLKIEQRVLGFKEGGGGKRLGKVVPLSFGNSYETGLCVRELHYTGL